MSGLKEIEILLVEDNATDAELTLRSLKKANVANSIVWVRDGAAALDFIFARGAFRERKVENAPKMVLLDLRLPKVEGMEVLRQIKGDPRTRIIPVIVLTSSKEERDIVDSYRLGVNSFVPKPVEFEAFSRVIAELGLYWLLINRPPIGHNGPSL